MTRATPDPKSGGCWGSLTLWCCLTMFTRLRLNSFLRSSKRDADKCGRPSTFSSARRDQSITHSTSAKHGNTATGPKPQEPWEGQDQSPAMGLSRCQNHRPIILPLVPKVFSTPNTLRPSCIKQLSNRPSKEHPWGFRDPSQDRAFPSSWPHCLPRSPGHTYLPPAPAPE